MKKSLLALAVTGAFAGAAQAQSSVTVYGLYDGGTLTTNKTESTSAGAITRSQSGGFSGNASASSRLGFRGTEQLSSDLSAFFNYELAIVPGSGELYTVTGTNGSDNANGTKAPRTSIVGLASKQFGSLAIGRQTTGIHSVVAGDIWGGNNMVGDLTYSSFYSSTTTAVNNFSSVNAVSGRVSNNATRLDNMVTYRSPSLMGLTLRIDHANNSLTDDGQPGIQTALSGIGASYTWNQFTVNANTTTTTTNEAIAVSSSFSANKTVIQAANAMFKQGPVTLQYTIAGNTTENKTTGAQVSKVLAQKLSAQYQVTPTIMAFAQYGKGGTQMAKAVSAANTQTRDEGLQVGAEYAFSKRTNLYAAYGNQERKNINTAAKAEVSQIAAGIKHTF